MAHRAQPGGQHPDQQHCVECGPGERSQIVLDYREGTYVCTNCGTCQPGGLVFEEAHERYDDPNDRRAEAGGAQHLHLRQAGVAAPASNIYLATRNGKRLRPRAAALQAGPEARLEATVLRVCSLIAQLAGRSFAAATQAAQLAFSDYMRLRPGRAFDGDAQHIYAAAAIAVACAMNKTPRKLAEVARGLSDGSVAVPVRRLACAVQDMRDALKDLPGYGARVDVVADSDDLAIRRANVLVDDGTRPRLVAEIRNVWARVRDEHAVQGKSPAGIGAALVLVAAARMRVTVDRAAVAAEFGVTRATMADREEQILAAL